MMLKKILTLAYLKRQKKKSIQENRPAVSLNFDATQWSETVSLVADKHRFSHRGLT